MATDAAAVPAHQEGAPGEKGLKSNALGMVSSVVIGVASTAPGYSLAASLGLVVAAVGFQSPAIMWLSFIPMLLVATSYYYLNRVDPDCGTTFSWATKAFGPVAGWLGGWGIIVADIIVMANLADIAGRYTFLLFGADSAADSKYAVLLVGVLWIAVMTWICYVGIEASAKTQWFLLGAELITLMLFAVLALWKVYADSPPGSVRPSLDWLNPFAIDSTSALASGLLVAVFIYWGWDSLVSVNEETEDKERTPGIAAIMSTIILVGIYVVVSVAAQAFAGTEFLVNNSDDVLSALGKEVFGWADFLLIIAVLTSASASTQTTILPTTRTSLSMASQKALPDYFARIHPRHLTPSTSTIWMGVLSIVWYAGLTIVSENILFDSIAALGLMIAFYYGLSGYACVWFFRKSMKTPKGILLAGVAPLLGALILTWVFVKSVIDLSNPENSESGNSWFGLGPPLVIAIWFLILGVVIMLLQWRFEPGFFRRKAELPGSGAEAMSGPIVLGYDGSESARAALAETARLAKELGNEVVVVFGFYISPLGGGDVRDYKAALEKVGSESTEEALSRLRAEGIEASARLVSAKPADALMQVAEEVQAGMIAVGTVGEGPITGAILGSVVLKLVQRCSIPLLVVPTG